MAYQGAAYYQKSPTITMTHKNGDKHGLKGTGVESENTSVRHPNAMRKSSEGMMRKLADREAADREATDREAGER